MVSICFWVVLDHFGWLSLLLGGFGWFRVLYDKCSQSQIRSSGNSHNMFLLAAARISGMKQPTHAVLTLLDTFQENNIIFCQVMMLLEKQVWASWLISLKF